MLGFDGVLRENTDMLETLFFGVLSIPGDWGTRYPPAEGRRGVGPCTQGDVAGQVPEGRLVLSSRLQSEGETEA